MKLSKKGKSRQRAIAKALASGKSLGGLLAGLAAAVFTGCRDNSPRVPMGDFPNQQQPNAAHEKRGRDASVRGKYVIEPKEEGNKINENNEVFTTSGEIETKPKPNAENEKEPIREEGGDVQIIQIDN